MSSQYKKLSNIVHSISNKHVAMGTMKSIYTDYVINYSEIEDYYKKFYEYQELSKIETPIIKNVKTYKDKYKPKDCVKHNATGNIFEIKSVAVSKHRPDVKQYWLVCLNDKQFPSYYSQEENLNAYFTKLNRNSVKILYGY